MKIWPSTNSNGAAADAAPERAKYPGRRAATDGSGAVVAMETAAGEAAGA